MYENGGVGLKKKERKRKKKNKKKKKKKNVGVGLKKKERKKKKMSLVISGSDLTTHKSWAPQSHLIYALAIEFQFSSFENS